MLKELWRNIDGYKGLYQVSSLGRVRSFKWNKEKILKQGTSRRGYNFVNLCFGGKYKSKSVHRLVADTFIGCSKKTVNHKNGNKTDNNVGNLEYLTVLENIKHGVANGLFASGEKNGQHKLSKEDVSDIRKLYKETKASSRSLAKRYNVSKTSIINIVAFKRWKFVGAAQEGFEFCHKHLTTKK